MENKVIIFYHRVDYDGLFSCAIVEHYVRKELGIQEVITKGWTYGDPRPSLPELKEGESCLVFLVDISFPPEDMLSLKNLGGYKVVWIDHHISAIDSSKELGYDDLEGVRRLGVGACELCWNYLYNNITAPKSIRLISAYDVWNKDRFSWDKETVAFQLGLKTQYGVVYNSINQVFEKLIEKDSRLTADIIESGKTINTYNQKRHKTAVGTYGFPVLVAGKYRGICMLTSEFGSQQFNSVINNYDITICVNKRDVAEGRPFAISMYSENETGLNLADYMKENFCGGGHRTAAGGSMTRDQFLQLIDTHTI